MDAVPISPPFPHGSLLGTDGRGIGRENNRSRLNHAVLTLRKLKYVFFLNHNKCLS